jgi:hypothetical protein
MAQPSAGTATTVQTGGALDSAGQTGAGQAGASDTTNPSGGAGGVGAAGAGGDGAGGGLAGVGGGAGSGGSGGADPEGWVKIFNGTDLTGWVPLIHKSAYNVDTYKTFRADPVTHVIKVTYEDYPDGSFDERCGVLYYNKFLTSYRVRLTYRFLEPQAKNPVGWGKNNSGLMLFGLDPSKVTGDPMFPPLIEVQLLGTPSSGGPTSPNICTPGGITLAKQTGICGDNSTKVPAPPAADWTSVEAEVHVNGDSKIFQYPEKTKPVVTISGPSYQGKPVTGGYLSIQSESQPVEFKDIELIELP